MSTSPPSGPSPWSDPAKLLQWSGLLGFNVEFWAWVLLRRPDPTLMGICALAASGGYLAKAVAAFRNPASELSPPPPPPQVLPPVEDGPE